MDETKLNHSKSFSAVLSGSIESNKYHAEGSAELLVSLHSTVALEFNGHSTANRLEYLAQMTTLVSDEKGPISGHGTDVRVRARPPHMSIESYPNKSQQLPNYIHSIGKQSVSTSIGDNSTSKQCWTSSLTMSPSYETSVKHLSVGDVSSDCALLSMDDHETVLPLARVPGSKLRPSALDFNDENIVVSMRSETGYRSEQITLDNS